MKKIKPMGVRFPETVERRLRAIAELERRPVSTMAALLVEFQLDAIDALNAVEEKGKTKNA